MCLPILRKKITQAVCGNERRGKLDFPFFSQLFVDVNPNSLFTCEAFICIEVHGHVC